MIRIIFSLLLLISVQFAWAQTKTDELNQALNQAISWINKSPTEAQVYIEALEKRQAEFNDEQLHKFILMKAANLGFLGLHKERVDLIKSKIDSVSDPEIRIRYLYHLSSGYSRLADYEPALVAMNEGISLLPKLKGSRAKLSALQGIVTILVSLRQFDDALVYVDRILEIDDKSLELTRCVGLANRVEIYFAKGERRKSRLILPEANEACQQGQHKFMTRILQALAMIDLVDSGNYKQGIGAGLGLVQEFQQSSQNSDYLIQIQEALARAYLEIGNLEAASKHAVAAFELARSESNVNLFEKSSETLGKIRFAQGRYADAVKHYEYALNLKNRVIDDQLNKNLAYQRVRYEVQDKANQLKLLEQQNKVLEVERELARKNNQNLWLFLTLIVLMASLLSLWLAKAIRQKNLFRQSSQVDALTQIANRMYFLAQAMNLFANRSSTISILVFDMDNFKRVNDTFGHSTGDWVLQHVCSLVKAHLRREDIFGRLGGEEFAICLANASPESALQLAERCRMAIAMIDTEPSGYRFSLSASFGIATVDLNGLHDFESTLEAADKALYQAKSDGRNCVSVYH